MEFDTVLSEEEIANNISKNIKQNNIFQNGFTWSFGDMANGFKMEGYIQNNNFHLVSYLRHYRKNIEINGSIRNMGETRKIVFTVNWLIKIDIIIYCLFASFAIQFILMNSGIHFLVTIVGFIISLIAIIKIITFLNKKIVNHLEKKVFKIIIENEYIKVR